MWRPMPKPGLKPLKCYKLTIYNLLQLEILVKAAQLILALVILVTVHEFGHYIFARIFGVKVTRFYLFFNPWFSILRYDPMKGTLEFIAPGERKDGTWPKPFKTWQVSRPRQPRADGKPTWRDTIYGLGWLPLGGYCAIAGMVDETQDSGKLAAEPQPWELRTKPAWQRLCVMAAGVVLNFVLAICIYIGIAFHWGDDMVAYQDMADGMVFSDELKEAGFRDGDILQSINGRPLEATDYSAGWDMLQPGARVGVLRGGRDVEVTVPDGLLRSLVSKGKDYVPMKIRVPVVVAKTVPGGNAAKAGVRQFDRIVTVAGDTTLTFDVFKNALTAHKGETVDMGIVRGDSTVTLPVEVSDGGLVGIQMLSAIDIYPRTKIEYTFFEAIPRGWDIATTQLTNYVSSLGLVFTKEGAQSLGGFVTLGSLFPSVWNWEAFWQMTAFLSIILAFMNIIPIPALDGGYILFLLVEIITRRRPSDRFIEIANTIGFFFLLALLFFANGNDFYRVFFK